MWNDLSCAYLPERLKLILYSKIITFKLLLQRRLLWGDIFFLFTKKRWKDFLLHLREDGEWRGAELQSGPSLEGFSGVNWSVVKKGI